ncbi:hypothetical protein BC832DRAFT_278932 [Gaertneriomyces semiglobifer]|nr:hypothetical protein BC832DRAFT_278932 [Gaertneriomyces semiglobifer]
MGEQDVLIAEDRAARILFERHEIDEWHSNHDQLDAPSPTSTTLAGEKHSYSAVPGRLLRNLTEKLVRTLDGLIISPSIPPALVQLLPTVRSNWVLAPSPCGGYLAVLTDDHLEVRSRVEGFGATQVVPLERDVFGSWRRVEWSFDSRMIALSASSGHINIIRATDGALLCSIIAGTKEKSTLTAQLPTKPVEVDWAAIGQSGRKERVGFVDPIAALLFVPPSSRSSMNEQDTIELDGHLYTHELIAITYDGVLRSYLLNAHNLGNNLPPPTTTSYIPAMHTRRASTVNHPDIQLLRECREHEGKVIFWHKFWLARWLDVICAATLDVVKKRLIVVGKRNRALPQDGQVLMFSLTPIKPHYRPLNVSAHPQTVNSDSNDPTDDELDDVHVGLWRRLVRKFLTLDSVLPSRRRLYHDTIHQIALSPNSNRIATCDFNGNMKLWRLTNEGVTLESDWGREAVLAFLSNNGEGGGHDGESVSENHGAESLAETPAKVVSFTFLTNDTLFLSLSHGHVLLLSLDMLQSPLSSPLPTFPATSTATCAIPEDRLFILSEHVHEFDSPSEGVLGQPGVLERVGQIVKRPLKGLVETVLWHWEEDDLVQQKRRGMSHEAGWQRRRTFSLCSIVRTTPQETYQRLIRSGAYDKALDLAERYELPKDDVWKARWENGEGVDALRKIQDKRWVLESCLSGPSAPLGDGGSISPGEVREVLKFGLRVTDSVTRQDLEDEVNRLLESPKSKGLATEDDTSESANIDSGGLSALEMTMYRRSILRTLDLLELHSLIYGLGPYLDSPRSSPSFTSHFHWFKSVDLVELCKFYAASERLDALHVMHDRNEAVRKTWLPIMNWLPEAVSIEHVRRLAPGIIRDARPFRRLDWTESSDVAEVLALVDDDVGEPIGENAETVDVSGWYVCRIEHCVSLGLLEIAQEWCQLAMSIPTLSSSAQTLSFKDLWRDIKAVEGAWHVINNDATPLQRVRTMSQNDIIHGMLGAPSKAILSKVQTSLEYASLFEDTFVSDIALQEIKEWAQSMVSSGSDAWLDLFGACANGNISLPGWKSWAISCANHWVGDIDLLERLVAILKTDSTVAHDAMAGYEGWDFAVPLPTSISADTELSDIVTFEKRVEALKILSSYSIQRSMQDIIDMEALEELASEKQRLVMIMARSGVEKGWYNRGKKAKSRSRTMGSVVDDEVEVGGKLLKDLRTLGDILQLPVEGTGNVELALVGELMRACEFAVAKRLVSSLALPLDRLEQLILDCTRELWDNAQSGDWTSGSARDAKKCLEVFEAVAPLTVPLQREWDFMHAVHRLTVRWNTSAIPMLVRTKREGWVERVIAERSTAWRESDKLIETALWIREIGDVPSEATTVAQVDEDKEKMRLLEKGKVEAGIRLLCAQKAVDHHELEICWNLLEKVLEGRWGWRGVVNVVESMKNIKTEWSANHWAKLRSWCLQLCPVEEVEGVVEVFNGGTMDEGVELILTPSSFYSGGLLCTEKIDQRSTRLALGSPRDLAEKVLDEDIVLAAGILSCCDLEDITSIATSCKSFQPVGIYAAAVQMTGGDFQLGTHTSKPVEELRPTLELIRHLTTQLQQQREANEFHVLWGEDVEESRWNVDLAYRKEFCLKIARNGDWRKFINNQVEGFSLREALVTFLRSVFEGRKVTKVTEDLRSEVFQAVDSLSNLPTEADGAEGEVAEWHSEVSGTDYDTLSLFYASVQRLALDVESKQELERRRNLLKECQRRKLGLDFKGMLKAGWEGVEPLLAQWKPALTRMTPIDISSVISQAVLCRPMASFKDESHIVVNIIDVRLALGRLLKYWSDIMDWELMDEAMLAKNISLLIYGMESVDTESLVEAIEYLGSKTAIPLVFRKDIVHRGLEILKNSDAPIHSLQGLEQRLSVIESLSSLSDPKTGDRVPHERVQQLEHAFVLPTEQQEVQLRSTVMRMVLASASPTVVVGVCSLLNMDVVTIYTEVIKCVFGLGSKGLNNVFRKGLDDEVSAVERVIDSIASSEEFLKTSVAEMKAEKGNAWDNSWEDGWDIDLPSPVKRASEAGWDIDLPTANKVSASEPVPLHVTPSEEAGWDIGGAWDIDLPPPAKVAEALPMDVQDANGELNQSSSAASMDSGWDIDLPPPTAVTEALPMDIQNAKGESNQSSSAASMDSGWDIDLPEFVGTADGAAEGTHDGGGWDIGFADNPTLGTESDANSNQSSTALVPNVPTHADEAVANGQQRNSRLRDELYGSSMPSAAPGNAMPHIRDSIKSVLEDIILAILSDRNGMYRYITKADTLVDILRNCFCDNAEDASRYRKWKVQSIVSAIWGRQVGTDVDSVQSRAVIERLLIGADVQEIWGIINVLNIWASEPKGAIPQWMRECYRLVLQYCMLNGLTTTAREVRITMLENGDVFTDEEESKILRLLDELGMQMEYFFFGLVSPNALTAQQTAHLLYALTLESRSVPLTTRIHHLLLLATNNTPQSTHPLFAQIRHDATQPPPEHADPRDVVVHEEMRRRIPSVAQRLPGFNVLGGFVEGLVGGFFGDGVDREEYAWEARALRAVGAASA